MLRLPIATQLGQQQVLRVCLEAERRIPGPIVCVLHIAIGTLLTAEMLISAFDVLVMHLLDPEAKII